MPELPEAETIARGLDQPLRGRVFEALDVIRPDVLGQSARRLRSQVLGQRVEGVGRRGKAVVLDMGVGGRIVVNLGMTGRLLPSPTRRRPQAAMHPAVVFGLDDGSTLVFDDMRRFGRVTALDERGWRAWSNRLGPEPLGGAFTGARLHRIVSGSRSPIRSLLLDQRKVAGIGNIYALEALWASRLHPARRGPTLTMEDAARLHRSLRRILRQAVRAGGTTLRDYRAADGSTGAYAPQLHVYGREGEPCLRCRSTILRFKLSGRSAYYCPTCQAPPPTSTEATRGTVAQ